MQTSPAQIIDHLTLVNRAYQVLYALGEESSTVRTLSGPEAHNLISICQDVQAGHIVTALDFELHAYFTAERWRPRLLEYIASGRGI